MGIEGIRKAFRQARERAADLSGPGDPSDAAVSWSALSRCRRRPTTPLWAYKGSNEDARRIGNVSLAGAIEKIAAREILMLQRRGGQKSLDRESAILETFGDPEATFRRIRGLTT